MAVLEARNITKRFPGVVALHNVDADFEPGKVHCILGENGAGKSTLIKILTGVEYPDEGSVLILGKDPAATKNKQLFEQVAYVPQEIDLFSEMTVAENLFMPFSVTGFGGFVVDDAKVNKATLPWLEKFNIKAKPTTTVKNLSVSEQQLLQVARAMVSRKSTTLVLDEPTTSLTTDDTERLFKVVRQIRDEGKAVIFISHKLDELFEIGDEVTVLRNGEKIDHSPDIRQVDIPWMIERMAGHMVDQTMTYRSRKVGEETLMSVDKLTGEKFSSVSFDLKKGEILGFSGLVGSGRSELMLAILGMEPTWSGDVTISGKRLRPGNTKAAVQMGFVYLPEERKQHGILQYLSVRDNIVISKLKDLMSGVGLSTAKENKLAQDVVGKFSIKLSSLSQQIRFLSGGNQQKTIIGRAMSSNPKVLVFDEPTKGIDVAAKADIYQLMNELAETGEVGIIFISSEMEEIMRCSNRIIAMHDGRIVGEYPGDVGKTELLNSIMGMADAPAEEVVQ
jgi:ribose transport system ATP-binding protein